MAESDRLLRVMYGMSKQRLSLRERIRFTWKRIKAWGKARVPRVEQPKADLPTRREMSREELAQMWDEMGV